MQMDRGQQLQAIELFHQKLWSDYGANYLLTSLIAWKNLTRRANWSAQHLQKPCPSTPSQELPQHGLASNWAYEINWGVLTETMETARWVPLKWSCEQVLKELS